MTPEQLNDWLAANKPPEGGDVRRRFDCPDGFSVSIQASRFHYCAPRESDLPAYELVELGYPSAAEESLLPFADDPEDPTETVYGYVPIKVVADVLTAHGA